MKNAIVWQTFFGKKKKCLYLCISKQVKQPLVLGADKSDKSYGEQLASIVQYSVYCAL